MRSPKAQAILNETLENRRQRFEDDQRERDELQDQFLSLHKEHMRPPRRAVLGRQA